MKNKVWLTKPFKRGCWHFGLARYADGSIRVSELFYGHGFHPVGQQGGMSVPESMGPMNLVAGERKRIVSDIYKACCRELGLTPEALNELKAS